MSANTRAKEIEGLRELHKPTTFAAWVCLGRDYRDQAEVQEWATQEEAQELSLAYTAFRLAQLRAELEGKKLSALKRRAGEAGVDEGKLEEADDADDIKAAVIDLIVAQLQQR
jgi:hypothetical protein